MISSVNLSEIPVKWISNEESLLSIFQDRPLDSTTLEEFNSSHTFLNPQKVPYFMLVNHSSLPPFCGGPPLGRELLILYKINHVQRKATMLNTVLHVQPLCHYTAHAPSLLLKTTPSSYTVSNFLAWCVNYKPNNIVFFEKDPTL